MAIARFLALGGLLIGQLLSSSNAHQPSYFEPNRGQAEGKYDFVYRGQNSLAFLNSTEARFLDLTMSLVGGATRPGVGQQMLPGIVNHYRQRLSLAGLPTYRRVRYRAVYPGTDLEYHFANGALEFDFLLAPFADSSQITLRFSGTPPVLESNGELRLAQGLRLHRPRAYSLTPDGRQEIEARYELSGGRVSFKLSSYNPRWPLLIDPLVASYLPAGLFAQALLVDAGGNKFIAGQIQTGPSTAEECGGPVPDVPDAVCTPRDAVVMKLDPAGQMLYSTIVGGPIGGDQIRCLAAGPDGTLFAAGSAASLSFPERPADSIRTPGFVLKLGPRGEWQSLTFNRFIIRKITATTSGEPFIAGNIIAATPMATASGSSFQATFGGGGSDGVVGRLTRTGAVSWWTYVGGQGSDVVTDFAISPEGDLWAAGWVAGPPFPAANPLGVPEPVPPFNDRRSFLVRLSSDGRTLKTGLRLPFDVSRDVYVGLDAEQNILLGGSIIGPSLPRTPGVFQPGFGGIVDTAVMKMSPDASRVLWATYLGVRDQEFLSGMLVDPSGELTLAGFIEPPLSPPNVPRPEASRGFPLPTFVEQAGSPAAFLAKLAANGQQLLYSTGPAGLPGISIVRSIAKDPNSTGIWMVGDGGSSAPLVVDGEVLTRNFSPGASAVIGFEPPLPVRIEKVSGDQQSGPLGAPLAVAMTVQVKDYAGLPQAGIPVVFRTARPTAATVRTITDRDGLASARNLLDFPGVITFEAIAEGAESGVEFRHTATPPAYLSRTVSGGAAPVAVYRISTVAGAANRPGATNGPAALAQFDNPWAVIVDRAGNVVVADSTNNLVRRISRDGIVDTIAGGPGSPLKEPLSLANAPDGSVLVGDDRAIWRIPPGGGPLLTMLAPTTFNRAIYGLGYDPQGRLTYAQSTFANYYRLVSDPSESHVAGASRWGYGGDGGLARFALFAFPRGLAFDREGNLYLSDAANHRIRKIDPRGIVTTIAGDGTPGSTGDGGPAVSARVNAPAGLATDSNGSLYIADWANHRIRVISTDGIIRTIAGTGQQGFSGDGGPALAANLGAPTSVYVDPSGVIYFSEGANHVIRKLTPDPDLLTGLISNAASYQTGPLAPGALFTVFGSSLTAKPEAAGEGLAETLGQVTVRLRESSGTVSTARLRDVSGGHATFLVPSNAATGNATIEVNRAGGSIGSLRTLIARVAPGITTAGSGNGKGPPLAYFVRDDGSAEPAYQCENGRCSPNPIDLTNPDSTVFLVLVGTGIRNGEKVEAWINGKPAEVLFAGAINDDGVDQVNLRVPLPLEGTIDVVVSVDGWPANPVWIAGRTETVGVSPISWDFYTGTEGWTTTNLASHRVEGGLWIVDPVGGDPYVSGPTINARASDYPIVRVRMSNACQGAGAIYFRTATNDSYSGTRRVSFDAKACPRCPNPPFVFHSIDMTTNPEWTGTITGVRLDPCPDGLAGTDADRIAIDSIRLSPRN